MMRVTDVQVPSDAVLTQMISEGDLAGTKGRLVSPWPAALRAEEDMKLYLSLKKSWALVSFIVLHSRFVFIVLVDAGPQRLRVRGDAGGAVSMLPFVRRLRACHPLSSAMASS
jgi:hypothetical protein